MLKCNGADSTAGYLNSQLICPTCDGRKIFILKDKDGNECAIVCCPKCGGTGKWQYEWHWNWQPNYPHGGLGGAGGAINCAQQWTT